MDEFEYQGQWWLPEFPDAKEAGILKFHPERGATLETFGGGFRGQIVELFGRKDVPFIGAILIPPEITIDLICGTTERGDFVTLWKCRKYEEGFVGTIFEVQVIFMGSHFQQETDLTFESMAINYSLLEQWLGITGFEGGFKREEARNEITGVDVKFSMPEKIDIRLNDFSLSFSYKLTGSTDRFVDFHAKQTTFVEIMPDQPMSYDDYQANIIYHLRNFLSLGIGVPVVPLIVKAKSTRLVQPAEDDAAPREIFIFYVAGGAFAAKKRPIDWWSMVFRYPDIRDDFETYIQKWFAKVEQLRPVFDIYFGLLYIPSMYAHLAFLTLAQALEAYHRRIYGGMYLTEEEYQPVRQALVQAIPPNVDNAHRHSLEKRIEFGYEYSLTKRLKLIITDVLAPYTEVVKPLIGDRDSFIKKVVNTRNYLTHYPEELEVEAATGPREQYSLIQKMIRLMQLCFFIELSLSPETVEKLAKSNHWF